MSVRRQLIAVAAAAAAVMVVAPAAAASQLLPDLGMARLKDFSIDTTTVSGHKLLRYTARMVNWAQARWNCAAPGPARQPATSP